jgi:antitoxin ParD1/3/4
MSKNTSIYLDDFFQNIIDNQIRSGKFSSTSEVIRAALRLFEQQEQKSKIVVTELKIGEKSSLISDYKREEGLKKLHSKHIQNGL